MHVAALLPKTLTNDTARSCGVSLCLLHFVVFARAARSATSLCFTGCHFEFSLPQRSGRYHVLTAGSSTGWRGQRCNDKQVLNLTAVSAASGLPDHRLRLVASKLNSLVSSHSKHSSRPYDRFEAQSDSHIPQQSANKCRTLCLMRHIDSRIQDAADEKKGSETIHSIQPFFLRSGHIPEYDCRNEERKCLPRLAYTPLQ